MSRTRSIYDEIFTLLLEAENVINCRQLNYISDNKDESFITPDHLMHEGQLNKKYFVYDNTDQINSKNA